jgi:hypothetical protein
VQVPLRERPFPPPGQRRRGPRISLRHSALVACPRRDFPATVHLSQAGQVTLAQLGGAQETECVTDRVQAAGLLGDLDRLLAPQHGAFIVRDTGDRCHRVVRTRQLAARRLGLQQGHGLRDRRPGLGQQTALAQLSTEAAQRVAVPHHLSALRVDRYRLAQRAGRLLAPFGGVRRVGEPFEQGGMLLRRHHAGEHQCPPI